MNEKNITNQLLIDIGKYILNMRLFRNNTGQGWVGEVTRLSGTRIVIDNPRPLHSGLCIGSSDLIGWTMITVTPEMVGQKVAVFTACEVKTKRGNASDDQKNFIQRVLESGGIAGVVRSVEDVKRIIGGIMP